MLPSLADALHEHIDTIALLATSALANRHRDLDERGTAIWNLASKLKDHDKFDNILALGGPDMQVLRDPSFADARSTGFCNTAA